MEAKEHPEKKTGLIVKVAPEGEIESYKMGLQGASGEKGIQGSFTQGRAKLLWPQLLFK